MKAISVLLLHRRFADVLAHARVFGRHRPSSPCLPPHRHRTRPAAARLARKSLETLRSSFSSNRSNVHTKLLDRVVLVEPKLHRNLKKLDASAGADKEAADEV